MPRDSAGLYSLPSSNPVVSDTLIETDWANPTMSDIGTELANSLDRHGRGSMLAPVLGVDGVDGAPGYTFAQDQATGMLRDPLTGALCFSVSGFRMLEFFYDNTDPAHPVASVNFFAFVNLGSVGSFHATDAIIDDDLSVGGDASIAGSLAVTSLTIDGAVPWTTANFTPSDYVPMSSVGAAGGVASLDGAGHVPVSQLPDLSGAYLPLTGGTVSGNLTVTGTTTLGSATIGGGTPWTSSNLTPSDYILVSTKGVANGVASLDSSAKVPVAQLPSLSGTYLPLTGGTISGNLTVTGTTALGTTTIGGSTPWTAANFTPSSYVPVSSVGIANGVASLNSSGKVPTAQIPDLSGTYLPLAGGTISGTLSVTGAATFNSNLLCNGYIIGAIGGLISRALTTTDAVLYFQDSASNNVANISWLRTSNTLNLSATAVTINGAVPWTGANFTPGNYLPLTGGTLSGALVVNSSINATQLTVAGAAAAIFVHTRSGAQGVALYSQATAGGLTIYDANIGRDYIYFDDAGQYKIDIKQFSGNAYVRIDAAAAGDLAYALTQSGVSVAFLRSGTTWGFYNYSLANWPLFFSTGNLTATFTGAIELTAAGIIQDSASQSLTQNNGVNSGHIYCNYSNGAGYWRTANGAWNFEVTGGAVRMTLDSAAMTVAVPVVLPADPTSALQASTKQYVDNKAANYLPLTGGTISGNLTVSGTTALGTTTIGGSTPWTAANLTPSNYVPTSSVGAANGVASLDSSGKVPTAQLPAGSSGSGGGPFKNRIINGDMRIDQRNSGSSANNLAATLQYVLDRWGCYGNSAAKFSTQRVAAPTGFTGDYAMKFTSLSAYTVGFTEPFGVQQNIEGNNIADLRLGSSAAQTFTLSFWAQSSVTGTYAISFYNGGSNRYYVATFSLTAATPARITLTIPGDTSGTWLTDNGTGLVVRLDLGSGGNYNATAGAWGTGILFRTSGCVNWLATNAATFYISQVQLELGSTASSFERQEHGDSLRQCQRYYFRSTAPQFQALCAANPNQVAMAYVYPVTMRGTPTMSVPTAPGLTNLSGYSTTGQDARQGFWVATNIGAQQVCSVTGGTGVVQGDAELS